MANDDWRKFIVGMIPNIVLIASLIAVMNFKLNQIERIVEKLVDSSEQSTIDLAVRKLWMEYSDQIHEQCIDHINDRHIHLHSEER